MDLSKVQPKTDYGIVSQVYEVTIFDVKTTNKEGKQLFDKDGNKSLQVELVINVGQRHGNRHLWAWINPVWSEISDLATRMACLTEDGLHGDVPEGNDPKLYARVVLLLKQKCGTTTKLFLEEDRRKKGEFYANFGETWKQLHEKAS